MAKDVLQSHIAVAVDNGNSFVKACFDGVDNYFVFPNVYLSTQEDRQTVLNQGRALDLLDVEIISPSLPEELGRHFFVGNLAARNKQANVITGSKASQIKSRRPETVLTALVAIAYAVAEKNEDAISRGVQKVRAEISLGIGLPILEKRRAAEFESLFTKGTHTVTFLTTPGFEGVSIEMTITLPDGVQVDDVSGIMDLALERGADLSQKSFGVADIGGVDMDIAFFNAGLILDDQTAGGERVNLNDEIAHIRKTFNIAVDENVLTSDAAVIDRLVKRNYDVRHQGIMKGNIAEISKTTLSKVAETVYKHVLNAWNEFPDAEEFLFIGGGSIILGPYIRDINDKEGKGRPIFFDDEKKTQLRNLRGTYHALELALKKSEVAASSQSEAK